MRWRLGKYMYIDNPVPCCLVMTWWRIETIVPRCPLVSEWPHDWPHCRLAKNRGTLYWRDCPTGANCKHLETNTWKQPPGTHRCDSKLPMATTWNEYVVRTPRPIDDDIINATIASRNSLWQFKQVCLHKVAISHQGHHDLSKHYQQTFKLVYIMHEVNAKIYEPNNKDDTPQCPKTS